MGTNFPDAADSFPSAADLSDDTLATKPHDALHGNLGDAVSAIESYLIGLREQRGFYSGAPISIDRTSPSPTLLPWAGPDAGVAVLDLTDPTEPQLLESGIWSVTASVFGQTEVVTDGLQVVLHLDYRDIDAVCEATYGAGSRADGRYLTSLNNTLYILAGGVIAVSVMNTDSVDHDVQLREVCVQRVG